MRTLVSLWGVSFFSCLTALVANFLIIGVEGANFFNNSTKRGKERGRGGREEGGEEEGEAEILLMEKKKNVFIM